MDGEEYSYKFTFKDFLIIVAIAIGWLLAFALLIAFGVVFFLVAGPRGFLVFILIMLMISFIYSRLVLSIEF